MTKINNKLFSDNFLNIDNIGLYNDLSGRNHLNNNCTKIYNQTESEKKINQIKYRYLLYKSIFNNNQSESKYNSTMMNPNSNKNFFSTNQESNNYGNLKLNQEISLNKINNLKAHDTFFNEYKYKKNLQNNGDNTNINNTGKNSHSCNKIIDKNEFIKKIKEIEDLDFSEEINKKKYTFFLQRKTLKILFKAIFFLLLKIEMRKELIL